MGKQKFTSIRQRQFKKKMTIFASILGISDPKKCDQKKSMLQQVTKLILLYYSCGGDLYLKSAEPSVQEFRA